MTTVFRRTVLLVDDNRSFREGLADVLRDEGVEALEAGSGQEAMRQSAGVQVDLVVLDLNLPDATGVAVYARLQQKQPGLPCIFMTAEATESLVQEAARLQPRRVLRKPFEIHLFRDLVRLAIGEA